MAKTTKKRPAERDLVSIGGRVMTVPAQKRKAAKPQTAQARLATHKVRGGVELRGPRGEALSYTKPPAGESIEIMGVVIGKFARLTFADE
jgi:hypothetical protein